MFNIVFEANVTTRTRMNNNSDIEYQNQIVAEYLSNQTGPLANIGGDYFGT